MNRLRIWWADSRGKVIATLMVLWIGALLGHFETRYVLLPIVAVGCSLLFDYLFSAVATKSTFVTGLLIGLLTGDIFMVIVACGIASFSKRFVGVGPHRHVFNPAALGILVSSFLFQLPVAWWGAAWGIAPIFIITIGMTSLLIRLRRIWMPMVFLLVYLFITKSLRLTIDGTVFFFAFIILPELMTSPSGKFWKYGWGALVGMLVFLVTQFPISVDPLLAALLVADVLGAFFVRRLMV